MTRFDKRGRPPHPDILTPAEWRTVDAVRHGMSNRMIAKRRGISLDAVKFHVANALDKLGLESRQELRMWRGAPLDSALARGERTMDSKLALGPLGQISRTVKDIKQAEAWYGSVLGLPHLYTYGNLAFFDCGGTRLFLEQETDGPAGPESVLYFRVPDINAAYEELASRGVKFTHAPHMIFRHPDGMEEWMAFFVDLEDRPLSIMSQVRPPAG
jgi:DNA-binding CsgD family transcriptional regulator/catechol 2,3-dioxygenase-like lactoylglutathione lyase family enzyme